MMSMVNTDHHDRNGRDRDMGRDKGKDRCRYVNIGLGCRSRNNINMTTTKGSYSRNSNSRIKWNCSSRGSSRNKNSSLSHSKDSGSWLFALLIRLLSDISDLNPVSSSTQGLLLHHGPMSSLVMLIKTNQDENIR